MTPLEAKQVLARADAHGAPYTIPAWHDSTRVPIDYGMAVAIAQSKHPSRVLANTNVYRYGKFILAANGTVHVYMFGQHIARFAADGVQLWSRGYVTVSTTEALGSLCDSAWFYTEKRVIYTASYAAPRERIPFTEGETFPYRSEDE